MTVRLSEPEASCKRTATVSSSLKRRLIRLSEVPLTAFLILRSCVFFIRFCLELAFGVNMKVVDNFVSFPMDLV
ncbi:hypothetical protein MTR_3g109670 [Medicago truncatula]|uniref:Uncharacterized protein n=1 Tax=Medicago truncatula TaxID=3880 RepID=G7J3G1_MEDTR|nr:hypothetical protein MTR_3g109670 [Medicago truncatula]